jgi:hypothetical protein
MNEEALKNKRKNGMNICHTFECNPLNESIFTALRTENLNKSIEPASRRKKRVKWKQLNWYLVKFCRHIIDGSEITSPAPVRFCCPPRAAWLLEWLAGGGAQNR